MTNHILDEPISTTLCLLCGWPKSTHEEKSGFCLLRPRFRATSRSTDLAKVVEALEPFAKAADAFVDEADPSLRVWSWQDKIITAGDLHRARQALASIKAEGSAKGRER